MRFQWPKVSGVPRSITPQCDVCCYEIGRVDTDLAQEAARAGYRLIVDDLVFLRCAAGDAGEWPDVQINIGAYRAFAATNEAGHLRNMLRYPALVIRLVNDGHQVCVLPPIMVLRYHAVQRAISAVMK